MSEPADKPTTWGTRLGIGFLSLFILSASYYGLYRVSLDEVLGTQPEASYSLVPLLGFSSAKLLYPFVELFFYPAHKFDRIVRPGVWNAYDDEYDLVGRDRR